MLLILVSLISISTIVYSQASGAATSVTGALCQIYNTVRNVIFLIGITLAVLGGVIYAVASIMPGSHKGGLQGYGIGMIIGGVLGIVIAVAAPYILNLIVSSNPNSILTSTGTAGVNGLCSSSSLL
jgi:hypothetical protein